MRRNTWIQTGLAFTFASGLFVFSAAGRQPSTIDGATTPVEGDRSTLNAGEPLANTLPPARRDSVEVSLIDRDGERIGTAYLTNDSMGVRIRTRAMELAPGEHGFHIHSQGTCEPPEFTSAGPHYEPADRSHGFLDPQGPHAGDLPTLTADFDGAVSSFDFTTAHVRLDEQSLLNGEGTSLIIHAQGDDYLTDTGGGTGERIACGVISPAR